MTHSYSANLVQIIFPVLALHCGISHGDDIHLRTLIEGNESAIALVRTIDMTTEMGEASTAPKVTHRSRWTADTLKGRERFRYNSDVILRDGYPKTRASNFEVLRDGNEFRILGAFPWDGTGDDKLTPFEQFGVHAWIDPTFGQGTDYRCMKPTKWLMWTFDLPYALRFWVTLRELVEMSGDAKVEGQIEVCGRKAWRLMLRKMIGAATDPLVITEMEVDVDVDTFYVLRNSQQYRNGTWTNGTLMVWNTQADELKQFDGDVLIPARTSFRVHWDDRLTLDSWFRVTSAKLNETLRPEDLAFKFPRYSLVKHLPAVDGRTRVQLWGADNQPIKDIASDNDLREFEHLAPGYTEYWRLRASAIMIVVGVNAALICVGLVRYVRRRRRKIQ